MNEIIEVVHNFMNDLKSGKQVDDLMKEYFWFPETQDFLVYFYTKLQKIVFYNDIDKDTADMYNILTVNIKQNNIGFMSYTDAANLLRIRDINSFTYSSFYEDGKLVYTCANKFKIKYIFKNEFNFDKFTSFTPSIGYLNYLLKMDAKPDVIAFLKTRLKLLKYLNGKIQSMKTQTASVMINNKGKKWETSIEDNVTLFKFV